MPVPSPLQPFIVPLERLGLSYCITGSVAASIYGEPRLTADIYLAGRNPLHQWALANRRRIDLDGDGLWVAPPEYVMIRKLEYFHEGRSDKHLRDIRFMLAATPVDRVMLQREVAQSGLQIEWLACLS